MTVTEKHTLYSSSVMKHLVRVHKWLGWTDYDKHKWSPRSCIYVVINGTGRQTINSASW